MFLGDAGSPALALDQNGGVSAFRSARRLVEAELVQRLPLYRRMAAQRLRSLAEAEEVAQAFALKALERAGQLREPLAVGGWLRRIFETTLIDHCRRAGGRRAREVPFDAQLHDRAEAEPPREAPGEAAAIVIGLLPRLKPDYAKVIEQVDLLERSRAEAACDLGITTNNLTVRLHRARAALRTQLAADPAWRAAVA
jgi:RNA polymerase sigma-70 factor (ECF subfamily)